MGRYLQRRGPGAFCERVQELGNLLQLGNSDKHAGYVGDPSERSPLRLWTIAFSQFGRSYIFERAVRPLGLPWPTRGMAGPHCRTGRSSLRSPFGRCSGWRGRGVSGFLFSFVQGLRRAQHRLSLLGGWAAGGLRPLVVDFA